MLRRFMPKSLYARTLLIVILPIFLMQTAITYFFMSRHWDGVTANLTANVASQIALITDEFDKSQTDGERQAIIDKATQTLAMPMRYEANRTLPQKDKRSIFTLYNSLFDRQLAERLDRDYWFNTSSWPAYVEVRVQHDSGYLVFLPLRERVFATTGPIFLLWLVGVTVLLVYVAILFLKNQVRSILRLAEAAEAFGRGREVPDYRPTGAREVRKAGYAFIAMRERINRHIRQRTDMLSAVSHDLRTPLTRLKLALAMMPEDPALADAQSDLAEMEGMLEEYMAFVRNQAIEEETEVVDLPGFLGEVSDSMRRAGADITLSEPPAIRIELRRLAVKRALENLINNAKTHGSHIWLSARKIEGHVEIMVDDDGPGIDPADYEDVFKPFTRLDKARSRNRSGAVNTQAGHHNDDNHGTENAAGVGLGLSLVRDVARGHGGDVVLDRAPQGGLRAILRLPR